MDQQEAAVDDTARWPVSSVLPPLGALPTAPAVARGHVLSTLAVWGLRELTDTVELVVSELAANGVNASCGPDRRPVCRDGRMPVIRVGLYTDGTVLLAEVWDQADGVPVQKDAEDDAESGRGLDMVDMLTGSRWDWHPASSGPGKRVWAEFMIPAADGGFFEEGHP
jgi:hypothetical protein